MKIGFYKEYTKRGFGFYRYHTLADGATKYGGWGFRFIYWGFYLFK